MNSPESTTTSTTSTITFLRGFLTGAIIVILLFLSFDSRQHNFIQRSKNYDKSASSSFESSDTEQRSLIPYFRLPIPRQINDVKTATIAATSNQDTVSSEDTPPFQDSATTSYQKIKNRISSLIDMNNFHSQIQDATAALSSKNNNIDHSNNPTKLLKRKRKTIEDELPYYDEIKIQKNSNSPNISVPWETCIEKYGKRDYLPEDRKRLPPMLYTFPGSGNTWCRLLLERATGIFTGSVYNDRKLLQALPGEFTCDWRVLAVKVHPHTHEFSKLWDGTFNSDANKCKRGSIPRFERAILLIRNPYDSIWSEYQRRVSGSHVEGVLKSNFQWGRWKANAGSLSYKYLEMWKIQYLGIIKTYRPEDVLIVRYEDLKDKQKRLVALERMTSFLRHEVTAERLQCAFRLAESRQAHRVVDASVSMTKEEAFTEEIACRMWVLFGKFASKYGYSPWNNYNCSSGYEAIQDIHVGPSGEWQPSDMNWARQGGRTGKRNPGNRGGRGGGARGVVTAITTASNIDSTSSTNTVTVVKSSNSNSNSRKTKFSDGIVAPSGNLGRSRPAWKSGADDDSK